MARRRAPLAKHLFLIHWKKSAAATKIMTWTRQAHTGPEVRATALTDIATATHDRGVLVNITLIGLVYVETFDPIWKE